MTTASLANNSPPSSQLSHLTGKQLCYSVNVTMIASPANNSPPSSQPSHLTGKQLCHSVSVTMTASPANNSPPSSQPSHFTGNLSTLLCYRNMESGTIRSVTGTWNQAQYLLLQAQCLLLQEHGIRHNTFCYRTWNQQEHGIRHNTFCYRIMESGTTRSLTKT